MADAAALKKLAEDYLHPEKPVVTSNPFATGCNYFTHGSVLEQDSQEEAEERAHNGVRARSTDILAGSLVEITVTKQHPRNQAFAWIVDQHHALYTRSSVRSELL